MPDAFDFLGDAITTDKGDIRDYPSSLGEQVSANVNQVIDTFPGAYPFREARKFSEDMSSFAGVTARVDRKAAEEEVRSRGLDIKIPAGGMTRYELDTLQYLKQREIQQNTRFERPHSAIASAAGFVAGAAVGVADPLNVASAFIPFVPEARYAMWLARAGENTLARAAVRVGAGAIEGAGGAVVLEPINWAGATSDQRDYGLMDSFINVTMGGVMGGGLHTIGGGVYDYRVGKAMRALDPGLWTLRDAAAIAPDHVQRTALQEAVATLEHGDHPVDVEHVFAGDARAGFSIYHVSPHKFDTPRLDAGDVGRTSGGWEEGAGLYGSNNPEVVRVHQELYTDKGTAKNLARAFVDDMGGDVTTAIGRLKALVDNPDAGPKSRENAAKALAYLQENGAPRAEPDVHTYEWKVNGDRETEFVDFRKPIAEQNPAVLEKLKAAGIDPAKDKWFKTWVQEQMKGEVYNFAEDPAAARERALAISKRLRDVGIKGAVYPTDREDVTGAGDNFVIYDPRDVTPVSRNGEPIGRRTPRDLAGLIEQSRADRTQGAFDRQFVDDGRAAAPKPEPKDHIARAEADFETANEVVEEFRKEGRLTDEDEAALKETDTAVKRAELKAKAVEAAAACMVAAQ